MDMTQVTTGAFQELQVSGQNCAVFNTPLLRGAMTAQNFLVASTHGGDPWPKQLSFAGYFQLAS
eukprot:1138119-Pelagomonas_calceolata.AAC.2